MSDLISRQEAIDRIEGITSSMSVCVNSDECHGMKRMQRQAVLEIANMTSAEPERKKGKWNQIISIPNDMYGCYYCSECGKEGNSFWYFCPNCGADMRGDGND